MDNRFFLWAAAGLIWVIVWQTYQQDYRPKPAAMPQSTSGEDATSAIAAPPTQLPALPAGSAEPASAPAAVASPQAPQVTVSTDIYELKIDTNGAKLLDVTLKNYPKRKDTPDDLVTLLSTAPSNLLLIQSGLLTGADSAAPNHESRFAAARPHYELAAGEDQLVVPLTWKNGAVEVTKTFTFRRGHYVIGVATALSNGGDSVWSGAPYVQLQRRQFETKRSMMNVDSYSFTGPVFYDGRAAQKYKPKNLRKNPIDVTTQGGWVAAIQHHFLSAIIPDASAEVEFKSRLASGPTELISGVAGLASVAPGASQTFEHRLFIGPKYQAQLTTVAPGLVRTVDYGMLSVLSQPLFWLLQKIHGLVKNWGWAIILMTLIIKILFYPLAEKSGRSMAKMRNLAPRMKSLQERYKDDRQALSKAMMDLYKHEQVNPMSSCLPLLLQMPVFLALYWVLIESVELRQAPFALWIQDLSARDPYFILPLIMAGAMFVQTKLNPAPADPTTAKVMMFMPIMMSVFFAFFPAGLVLYWVVNTVLSVAQQWRINKVVEAAAKTR